MTENDAVRDRQVTFWGAIAESALIGTAVLLMASGMLLRQGSLARDQLLLAMFSGLVTGALVGALANPLLRRFPGRAGPLGGAVRGLGAGAILGVIILGLLAAIFVPLLWSTDVWFPPPIAGAIGMVFGFPLGAIAGFFIGAISGLVSTWDRQRFRVPGAIVGALLATACFAALIFAALWLVRPEAGELLYTYPRLLDMAVSPGGDRIALLAAEAGPLIPSEDYEDVRLIILDGQG